MHDGRIRRSNSCTSATRASFPITNVVSSSYQEQQHSLLGGSSFPASYTPPLGRAVRFNDLDENDDNGNNQCEHDSNNNNNNDVSTEDESDHPVVSKSKNPLRRRSVEHSSSSNDNNINSSTPELSRAQKAGCFNYIKRRHSIALAFASDAAEPDVDSADASSSNWEFAKTKHGVTVFKSKRSRCEVRGVTRVNSSVKNVMSLLAPGESTASFAHAQKILLGDDNVLEASVLAQCVPSSASRYFHCGLKHMALKNPFGITPIDLVFLDYTDVSTTPDGKLVGYRIMESIRVPEFRAVPKYIRASLRCEVYVVRETDVPGVVDVTFASHLDPKSKYASSKRSHWLDQASTRLSNLRSYAEKASFSHKLILEKGKWIQRTTRPRCVVCDASFSFLRKRHNCRLCGEVTCGRCSRKLPILVDTVTTRVRVCLRCILDSRHDPDELGRSQFGAGANRRGSVGNATYIAYDDDVDPVQALEQLDNHKHEHPCVRNEFVSA